MQNPAPLSSLYNSSTPAEIPYKTSSPIRISTSTFSSPNGKVNNPPRVESPSRHPNEQRNTPPCSLVSPSPSSSTSNSNSHSTLSSQDSTSSYLDNILMNAALPPPGPSHYAARRALWLEPPYDPPEPPSPSPSRIKLEALLSQDGAAESDEVWRAGLKNVWKGLVGGNQLRKRLPLSIVLKILQAGWLRDGTWPQGAVAPEPDDVQPPDIQGFPPPAYTSQPSSSTNYPSSLRVTPSTEMDAMRETHEDEGDGRHEGG